MWPRTFIEMSLAICNNKLALNKVEGLTGQKCTQTPKLIVYYNLFPNVLDHILRDDMSP